MRRRQSSSSRHLRTTSTPSSPLVSSPLSLNHFHLAILLLHKLSHALLNAHAGVRRSEDFLENNPLSECGYSLEHATLGAVLGHRTLKFFERRRRDYCDDGTSRSFSENLLTVYEWPSGVHWDRYRGSGAKMAWRHPISPATKVWRVPLEFVVGLFEERFWEGMAWAGAERVAMEVETVAEWWAFWFRQGEVSEVRPYLTLGEAGQVSTVSTKVRRC